MKKLVAIPTVNKQLCAHFGHCEQFAIVETIDNKISKVDYVNPPEHQPGTYPRFLANLGVSTIVAGGIGVKAQDIFKMNNIDVVIGINADTPENIVDLYLKQQLTAGDNMCDH